MEAEKEADHPYVYIDRARLKMLLNRHKESLPDLDKDLLTKICNIHEKLRALVSRFIVRAKIGLEQGSLEDLKAFGELKADKPTIEHIKKNIIIRNIPDCNCYRKLMKGYFIHSKIFESKKNIKMLKCRICIVDKACESECDPCEERNFKDQICDACNMTLKAANINKNKQKKCKSYCDQGAITGAMWCGNIFKGWVMSVNM